MDAILALTIMNLVSQNTEVMFDSVTSFNVVPREFKEIEAQITAAVKRIISLHGL